MKKSAPLISVCIPVFETEAYLADCLRSAWEQDFSSFEIVVVSDASDGKDAEGKNARKIVKIAEKTAAKYRKENKLAPVNFKFIEHRENRGLIEVRRTLCHQASGLYLTQLDSDDELEKGALSSLYNAAKNGDFDIVHGTSTAGLFDLNGEFIPAKENRYGIIFYGRLYDHEVFSGWLLKSQFTANTWGKLIKRDLWLRAYENIPYTECNMADDVLLFFFLAQIAKSYIGIEDKVYRYRINTGMSSGRRIDSIKKWRMICSAASVFTVISEWIKDNPGRLTQEEENHIRRMTAAYLSNNLLQLRETVIPPLQQEAKALLCEFWGQSFVNRIEKSNNCKK